MTWFATFGAIGAKLGLGADQCAVLRLPVRRRLVRLVQDSNPLRPT